MKVLWLSNKQVLNEEVKGSGSWLTAMAEELSLIKSLELVNITEGDVSKISTSVFDNRKEILIPKYKLTSHGLPERKYVNKLIQIIEEECPDIIHVWGVENYWGLLVSRGHIQNHIVLLDMQGVLEACYEFYTGNLCFGDFISKLGFWRALYAYSFIRLQKQRMKNRVLYENEIISSFPNIAYQSEWVKSWVSYKNPKARLFPTKIAVRKEFLVSQPWSPSDTQKNILLVTSQQAYKRVDIAIKALHILISQGIEVNLVIVGDVLSKGKGYSMYLESLIKKNGLQNRVNFVGPKNANEIIDISRNSRCMIVPSSVESYSLVMAESIALGLPVVSSYSGAMPEFFCGTPFPVYFPSGDYVKCASVLKEFLISNDLCNKISQYELAKGRIIPNVGKIQFDIYSSLLNEKKAD